MSNVAANQAPAPEADGAIVSKAFVRTAQILDLPQTVVARSLGLSPATVTRLMRLDYLLTPGTKGYEIALLLLRLYRSLDSITGSDDQSSRSWMIADNTALGGRPIDLIQSVEGLVRTVSYLDSRRAVI